MSDEPRRAGVAGSDTSAIYEMRTWAHITKRLLRRLGEVADAMSESRSRLIWRQVR